MPISTASSCGLFTPCKRALTRLFRFRAFRFRSLCKAAAKMSPRRLCPRRRTLRLVRAVFWQLVPPAPATSSDGEWTTRKTAAPATEMAVVHAPLPSPETPAYVKIARLRSRTGEGKEAEACRSFERRLTEMLVEEGKVMDLQDVEELLQCWDRLKSPVFVELVCRFYGELCKDMFPAAGADGGQDEGSVSSSAA